MEYTSCGERTTIMTTLKKLDTEENRQYWEFIKKSAQEAREQRPAWARELEQKQAQEAESPKTASNSVKG